MTRIFQLVRDHDVTGVSGTGVVADGALWPDGTVDVRWRGPRASSVHWDRLDDAEAVHGGHGGATRIVWDEYGERNRLARQVADITDERDAVAANLETARDDLTECHKARDNFDAWLGLIAEQGCQTWITGPGSCTRPDVGRYAVATRGTAYQWCDPCRAWAALNGVPMTTQPAEEPTDG